MSPPKMAQKGGKGKKIFQKGGNSGRETHIGRWHYEKNHNFIMFCNPHDLFFRMRTKQHSTQSWKSGHTDYVARLRQPNKVAAERRYQRI